ncbi:MAG: hypothetical protein ACJ74Y_00260 [Bryobacteraceae bacterium]
MLLSLDGTSLVVLQASENVTALFGRSIFDVLGKTRPDLLGPAQAETIVRGLQSPSLEKIRYLSGPSTLRGKMASFVFTTSSGTANKAA